MDATVQPDSILSLIDLPLADNARIVDKLLLVVCVCEHGSVHDERT
jgi:hypothetical protein